jgi:hypothetical protein
MARRRSLVGVAPAVVLAGVLGCGGTSAKVLERVDAAAPPVSNLRVDVFLLRSVSTCAIGRQCTAADPSNCFYVADAAGPRISFSTDGLRFVRPGDPAIVTADRVQCFTMILEDTAAVAIRELMKGLRVQVFQASNGNIDLDIRIRELTGNLDAWFTRYYTGLFLPPEALNTVALGSVSRDTDLVYAITGFRDPDTTLQPKLEFCNGTNKFSLGVLGASPYTWMAVTDRCLRPETLMGTFMIQVGQGMRDIAGVMNPRTYPACGDGDPDPLTWFPDTDECTRDPDAPTCGLSSCPDQAAFYKHVLTTHWRQSVAYNGNYCADGRMDYDETDVDSGGVCDLIGR